MKSDEKMTNHHTEFHKVKLWRSNSAKRRTDKTYRQTDKETDTSANMTSLAER